MFAPFDTNNLKTLSMSAIRHSRSSPCTRLIQSGSSRIALRLSLAAGFLSAVADRFGWWKPFGQGSWGSMGAFADYTHQLVPFASGWLLTVIVWAATTTETTLGVLLLTGWRPKLVRAATCLVLIIFATAMAVSLGMESPLSYSVFSAASAAAAYAILGSASGTKIRVDHPY